MSYYVAPFTFDFATTLIQVDSGTVTVDVGALYDAIKEAQASAEGILYSRIAAGSGLADLGEGVFVGLTVELLGSWQLKFDPGAYNAKISGGNLVGGPAGDPVAYSAGVQVLLILSAASTVVELGAAIPTAEENAIATWQRLIEDGFSAEALVRLIAAQAIGNATGLDGTSVVFKSMDGTKNRVEGTVIGGARTVAVRDGS